MLVVGVVNLYKKVGEAVPLPFCGTELFIETCERAELLAHEFCMMEAEVLA
jgi:hypothetical protein